MTKSELKDPRERLSISLSIEPGDPKILDAKERTAWFHEQSRRHCLYAPHAVAAALNDLSLTMKTMTDHWMYSGSANPVINSGIKS
jgi:hypothetical protein